ncbi:S8 family peptidase [Bacillus solitudinis]|uniref:S8 family peptidase n=1 Tax=Bacillus solitudinis TaxID=2014074 RepID=UPI000C240F48|nr:S8 family serine peptidase [Bacillus solitudinis]
MFVNVSRTLVLFLLFTFLQLQSVAAQVPEYIILFKDKVDEERLAEHDITILESFETFPGIVVEASKDTITEMKTWDTVSSIEMNQEFQVEATAYANWGIDHLNIPASWSDGYTGKGVKVAVIDSGISTTHPALNVVGGISMVDYTTSYEDDNGHGTHSAGIIAAKQESTQSYGVAYNVQLYAVKSLDRAGNGRLADTIKGIEWAVSQQIDIVNLSLGTTTPSLALKAAVDNAFERNVLIVAAAGNKKEDYSVKKDVEYPARYGSVIAVSAVDSRNRLAAFSATGPEIEFTAPGVGINSTFLGGGYKNMSGTSMATPFVAGALALYKEAYPTLSANEIRKLAQTNALKLTSSTRDESFGYGLIQPPKKVVEVLASPNRLTGNIENLRSDGRVDLSLAWSHATPEKVKSYNVYRDGTLQANVSQPNFSQLISPGSYQYVVAAVDADGKETPKSNTYEVVIDATDSSETPVQTSFHDVNSNFWATPYISYLANKRIISGYDDGYFQPNAPVRRGQAVAMISRALGWDATQSDTLFSDVGSDYYASGAINIAAERRILSGFSDGTFRPNAPITRAQMAAILGNAFELNSDSSVINRYTDVTSQTTGYRQINHLSDLGIVSGYDKGYFKPNQSLTRAQFSVILSRILNEDFRLNQ